MDINFHFRPGVKADALMDGEEEIEGGGEKGWLGDSDEDDEVERTPPAPKKKKHKKKKIKKTKARVFPSILHPSENILNDFLRLGTFMYSYIDVGGSAFACRHKCRLHLIICVTHIST